MQRLSKDIDQLKLGNLEVVLASTEEEIIAAQKLRYKVFVLEKEAGTSSLFWGASCPCVEDFYDRQQGGAPVKRVSSPALVTLPRHKKKK